jgi:hypothetical protein
MKHEPRAFIHSSSAAAESPLSTLRAVFVFLYYTGAEAVTPTLLSFPQSFNMTIVIILVQTKIILSFLPHTIIIS